VQAAPGAGVVRMFRWGCLAYGAALEVSRGAQLVGTGLRSRVIDTHCHLTFPEFADRLEATIGLAEQAGVDGLITIATTHPDAARALAVARRFARVWSSAGVHPLYADELEHDFATLRACAREDKCVAWGELGLDNHHAEPSKAVQLKVLHAQLELIADARSAAGAGSGAADRIDKPVIIHCREAFEELVPILRASGIPGERFVFHCFTAGPAQMRLVLELGAMVSFTGVVTYKNAGEVRAALELVPLDRLMVETDAPFLPPEPRRSERPCQPAFARITAEFIAKHRGVAWEAFDAQLSANTRRFFGVA